MAENQQNETQEFKAEYQNIKSDVKKVVITNLLIIVLLAGLFFANRKFGWLNFLQGLF